MHDRVHMRPRRKIVEPMTRKCLSGGALFVAQDAEQRVLGRDELVAAKFSLCACPLYHAPLAFGERKSNLVRLCATPRPQLRLEFCTNLVEGDATVLQSSDCPILSFSEDAQHDVRCRRVVIASGSGNAACYRERDAQSCRVWPERHYCHCSKEVPVRLTTGVVLRRF
jgi:hypothetical protein